MQLTRIADLATLQSMHAAGKLQGFFDVAEDLYHGSGIGLSQSQLKDFARSPAHFRAARISARQPTKDMVRGSALHALVLEGEAEYAARYAVMPDFTETHGHPNSNVHKAAKAKWRADNLGKASLDADTHAEVMNMARRLGESRLATSMIEGASARELTGFWWWDGVLCRMRIDLLGVIAGEPMISDLKTTRDARPEDFAKTIGKFKYDWQMAFYARGFQAITGERVQHCAWVVVEPDAPAGGGVACFRLVDDHLRIADGEVQQALRAYRDCSQGDVWPGYPDEIQDIHVPQWRRYQK